MSEYSNSIPKLSSESRSSSNFPSDHNDIRLCTKKLADHRDLPNAKIMQANKPARLQCSVSPSVVQTQTFAPQQNRTSISFHTVCHSITFLYSILAQADLCYSLPKRTPKIAMTTIKSNTQGSKTKDNFYC